MLTTRVAPDAIGVARDRRARDALVQAQRRMDTRRERRMVGEGIGGERLLEALQIEPIEAGQARCVGEGVTAVRVRGERKSVTDGVTRRVQHRGVATRLDLALHAPVPVVEVAAEQLAEVRVVVAEPDRDAGVDAGAHRAEMRGERDAITVEATVEQRALEGSARRAVATDGRQWYSRKQRRQEVLAQDEPGGVDRVGGIGRGRERGALTPALSGISAYAHEQRLFRRGPAVRRAKGLDQWHADAEELGFVEDGSERTRKRARACGPGSFG